MAISARVISDSLSPHGCRLTTFECTFPRFILAEWNTHRMLSRNAASSRAIPIEKMIGRVLEEPAGPVRWGSNGKGMQDHGLLPPDIAAEAERVWREGRLAAVETARKLEALGVHKQISNRVLEPWSHITVIASATSWGNFFHLRRAPDAQPEFKALADAMWEAYHASTPIQVTSTNYWHLPLVSAEEIDELKALVHGPDALGRSNIELAVKVSVGRCARVSYLTHNGFRDFSADIALHDQLMTSGHWSPFEHVARPLAPKRVGYGHGEVLDEVQQSGNYRGWLQYRKAIETEHPFSSTNGGLERKDISPEDAAKSSRWFFQHIP